MDVLESIEDALDSEESKKTGEKTPKESQEYWEKELEGFKKRTRKYKKRGAEIVERFTAESVGRDTGNDGYEAYSLNLFHSNVVTQQSMLYGSTPQSEVSREHHDPDDDIARVSSLIFQRMLQSDFEPSGDGLPTTLKACLQDRLLPGMGIARVRYEMHTTEQPRLDPMTGAEVLDEDGNPVVDEVFDYEEAPCDYIHWGDVAWSWGRTWKELHWLGFKNYLTKDEATKRFGEKTAKKLSYKVQSFEQTADSEKEAEKDEQSVTKKAEIWEIWCKADKKVYWVQRGQEEYLDCKDDPLRLDGFWPTPKPMIANQTTKMFLPTADFILAQDLYNQIDTLYTRITIITRAVKVMGVYDQGSGPSVGRMLQEGNENDLIPVDNWAMFSEGGGLRGKIDWYPVEAVVQTLTTLQSSLEQQKALLYEVTGIADIMRGNTQQYAGVGQDQMAAKFGSIRIQALQDDFARFASELQELRAEVIAKHFEPQSIIKQSSAQYLPKPDLPLVQPALQLIKSGDCKWRVNIRPETIAMVDYQQLKAERTEYIMAISQYIQSAQAMAKEVPNSMPVLLEMMKWGVAGFKGANYLEGILDQAIKLASDAANQPQQGQEGPSPEQTKLQTEQLRAQTQQAKSEAEIKKVQVKAQADMQALQTKIAGEIQKMQLESQLDSQLTNSQLQARMQEMMQEFQNDLNIINSQLESDLAVEEAQARFDIAGKDVDHAYTMTEIAANRRGGQ